MVDKRISTLRYKTRRSVVAVGVLIYVLLLAPSIVQASPYGSCSYGSSSFDSDGSCTQLDLAQANNTSPTLANTGQSPMRHIYTGISLSLFIGGMSYTAYLLSKTKSYSRK